MGQVKNDIQKLIKEQGSLSAAKSFSEKWFEKGRNTVNEKGASFTSKRFFPGKIYVFRYSPISKTLPWYDKNPVVLALDPAGLNDVGINLNLLPNKVKEDLLDKVYGMFSAEIKNNTKGGAANNVERQKHLSMTWENMKGFMKGPGYDFALRQYKVGGKSGQAYVSYENWAKIALCDFADLQGTSYSELERLFKKK